MNFARLALALAAPLLLMSCVLSPGRFVSSLHIAKDRGFTFTYVGEVILIDPAAAFGQGMQEGLSGMGDASTHDAATGDADSEEAGEDGVELNSTDAPPASAPAAAAAETEQSIAEGKAVAEALSKEVGYRSVEYLGRNKFRVDYQMTGRLDRSFVYPINLDAKSMIP